METKRSWLDLLGEYRDVPSYATRNAWGEDLMYPAQAGTTLYRGKPVELAPCVVCGAPVPTDFDGNMIAAARGWHDASCVMRERG